MIHLTPQERTVLLVLAAVLLFGSILHYVLRKYPSLRDIVNLAEKSGLHDKADIKTVPQRRRPL